MRAAAATSGAPAGRLEHAVAPHREALARRLHEEHRAAGDAFWTELNTTERDQWLRVARHIEQHTDAFGIRLMSA